MSKVFDIPLYHGTAVAIDRIDVSFGRPQKDFGQGFYMALSVSQAIGMMHKKYREAVRRSRNLQAGKFSERLYRICLNPEKEASLRIKTFETVDLEWLDFILKCRATISGQAHDYDMVIGPTADDDTMIALRNYRSGFLGEVGSDDAKQALIRILKPRNLGIQCCICNQAAVNLAIERFELVDWRLFA